MSNNFHKVAKRVLGESESQKSEVRRGSKGYFWILKCTWKLPKCTWNLPKFSHTQEWKCWLTSWKGIWFPAPEVENISKYVCITSANGIVFRASYSLGEKILHTEKLVLSMLKVFSRKIVVIRQKYWAILFVLPTSSLLFPSSIFLSCLWGSGLICSGIFPVRCS